MPSLDQPILAARPAASPVEREMPQLTLQPVVIPGDEPSAVGAVINPAIAPAGFFSDNGLLGTPIAPVSLNLDR